MNAKKCDRCRRFYEPYSRDQDHKWHGEYLSVTHTMNSFDGSSYDLCPVCAKALVNFMATYEDVEFCSDRKD